MRVTVSRIAKAYLVGVIWLLTFFATVVVAVQPLDSLYATLGVATLVRIALTMSISIAVATAAAGACWWLLVRTESSLHSRLAGTSQASNADLMPVPAGRSQR